MNDFIRSFDIYGRTITFTYKGEERYSTILGGIISVIVSLMSIIYFGLLVKQLINHEFVSHGSRTGFDVQYQLGGYDGSAKHQIYS